MKTKILENLRSPRVLILVTPFILMAPVWLAGKAMYWGTPSTQFIPWWWQAWRTILSGEVPLWNPLVGMGAPLLANYQSALLYPPTWLYFGLAALGGLPLMAWGQAILVALHLAWAGWGMGLLVRRLGKGDLAQTVGGLAFGLSAYLVSRAHFLSINSTVSWLPWILLLVYELVHDPHNKKALVKLALALAMQWLAGHAQTAWYTLILAVAWAAFWAWRAGGWRDLANIGLRIGLVCLLAFGLAAAQLLPTAEYLANSQRAAQVAFDQAATYSFWPWRLIGLAAPDFFGNPAHGDYWGYGNFWEDAIYVGLLPLFLAIAGFWWSHKQAQQRGFVFFLLGVILVSFLLALGKNTPLFEWLYLHVPTFALFQSPARFTIWMVFALALLAALAADQWRPPQGRALYWSRLGAAAAVAVMLGAGIGWLLISQGAIQAPPTYFYALAATGLLALAAAFLHLRAPKSPSSNPRWGWLVCGLVAADLLVAGWGLNPGADLELYKEDAELSQMLHDDLGEGRLYISDEDDYALRYETLFQFEDFHSGDPELIRTGQLPNISILDGIPSASNYDPLVPARYRNWIAMLNDSSVAPDLWARMSVNLLERVQQGGPLVAFVPVDGMPRARWVDCVQPVDDAQEALASLASSNFDPGVVTIEGAGVASPCPDLEQGHAEIADASANSVTIAVNAPDGGWLVLADTYYPGWRAFVNGQEKTIYPADGVFRVIDLEPGQCNVDFRYQPLSFSVGLALSLACWIGLYWYSKRAARESTC